MMNEHSEKQTGIAVVTGADRGLGLALTQRLLAKGWCVFAGQYMPEWPELGELHAQYPGRLELVPLDVADTNSTLAAAEKVGQRTDHVDMLISNAGVQTTQAGSVRDSLNYDEMHRMYNVNTLGTLRVVDAFLPLVAQSAMKRFCFISSESGSINRYTRPSRYGYAMSKAALNMQIKMLFNRLHPEGYTFRVFHPGWVRTYMRDPNGMEGMLSPEESAASALTYFIRDRGSDPHILERSDEHRLVMRDHQGREWPW